jgi:hypothetical protein
VCFLAVLRGSTTTNWKVEPFTTTTSAWCGASDPPQHQDFTGGRNINSNVSPFEEKGTDSGSQTMVFSWILVAGSGRGGLLTRFQVLCPVVAQV